MSKSQQPDLSKVPEGATHWTPRIIGCSLEAFWRPNGEYYDCFALTEASEPFWQRNNFQLPSDAIVIAFPWAGEGLPPVGQSVEVEVRIPKNSSPVWMVGRVAAHDTPVYMPCMVAIVELVDPRAGPGLTYIFGEPENFRPIRTSEQIAAEERLRAVKELAKDIDVTSSWEQMAEQLYDAGYRKQVAP